jgi:hypothetical protein
MAKKLNLLKYNYRGGIVIPLTTLFVLTIGCASSVSTKYIPKNPNLMRISVSHGQSGLAKNNAFAGFGPSTPVRRGYQMADITKCDKAVEAEARRAKGNFQESAAMMNVATIMVAIGVAPGVVALSILTPISVKKGHDAMSAAVDALNMHNDTDACINPVAPPPSENGSAAGQSLGQTGVYTNMAELKAARLAGKLSDNDYRQWQQNIRNERQKALNALDQDYHDNKVSRSEYKDRQREIVLKYEGAK